MRGGVGEQLKKGTSKKVETKTRGWDDVWKEEENTYVPESCKSVEAYVFFSSLSKKRKAATHS